MNINDTIEINSELGYMDEYSDSSSNNTEEEEDIKIRIHPSIIDPIKFLIKEEQYIQPNSILYKEKKPNTIPFDRQKNIQKKRYMQLKPLEQLHYALLYITKYTNLKIFDRIYYKDNNTIKNTNKIKKPIQMYSSNQDLGIFEHEMIKDGDKIQKHIFYVLKEHGYRSYSDLNIIDNEYLSKSIIKDKKNFTVEHIIAALRQQRQILDNNNDLYFNYFDNLFSFINEKRYEYVLRREFKKAKNCSINFQERATIPITDTLFGYNDKY